MNKPRGRSGGGNQLNPLRRYLDMVNMMHNPNLIGYWPMDEAAGAVALDYSGKGNHSTYNGGITLGFEGIGDGRTSAFFDGASGSYVQLPANFRTAFDGAQCTISWWALIAAAQWVDGTSRNAFNIQVDANNSATVRRIATNNQMEFRYTAGATLENITGIVGGELDFVHHALVIDKANDLVTAYRKGVAVGSSATLGVFAGTPVDNNSVVGSFSNATVGGHLGRLAHFAVWTMALSAREIAELAKR